MNKATSICLIFLRLALGWTILVEGLEKIQKDGWTSEPYLRESSGPLAPHFRQLAGDAVEERVAVLPAADGANTPNAHRIPARLEREWQAYFDRFADYYQLDEKQRADAATKLDQRKDQVVKWMLVDKITVKKTSPWSNTSADISKTPVEWREDYLVLRRKAEDVEAKEMTVFGKATDAKLTTAKGDASKIRSELQKGVVAQNADMQKALATVLTPEQAKREPLAYASPVGWKVWNWRLLDWADASVKYGLTAAGICLIVGLFSRSAAFVGAALLLLFYLAMPPFPGTPPPARTEGTYLYFNKTFVEVLALLVLATVPTGRWLGLDGLIYAFRSRRSTPEPTPPAPSPRHADLGADTPRPDLAEPLTNPAADSDNGTAVVANQSSLPKDSTDGN